jgi:copper chaperone CopZ
MTDLAFEVDGMTCGGCTARVERALGKLAGVKASRVTLNPGRALVQVDDAVSPADVQQAITAAGYPARRIES